MSEMIMITNNGNIKMCMILQSTGYIKLSMIVQSTDYIKESIAIYDCPINRLY